MLNEANKSQYGSVCIEIIKRIRMKKFSKICKVNDSYSIIKCEHILLISSNDFDYYEMQFLFSKLGREH